MNAQSKTLLFFVFLTIVSIRLFGHNIDRKEFKKEINKEFRTTSNGEVSILNKYGTVAIKSWNKNQVKIDVVIVVNASSRDKADEVFDRININFVNRMGFVSAETVIASQTSSSFWFWNTTSKDDYKIHFVVYMPKSNALTLKTKYCDSSLDYLSSKGDLHVKYGDFTSEGFGGNVNMVFSYGNGKIITLNKLNGDLSYGKLSLNNCNEVDLDSKYSKLKILQGKNIKLNSKYDDIKCNDIGGLSINGKYSDISIDQVDNISFHGKYSDLIVGLLINDATINCKYGDVVIQQVENGFGLIQLEGKYSDFTIDAKSVEAYCIEANTKYGDIHIPSNLTITNQSKEGNQQQLSAYLTSHYCSSKIRGIIEYGKLRIVR